MHFWTSVFLPSVRLAAAACFLMNSRHNVLLRPRVLMFIANILCSNIQQSMRWLWYPWYTSDGLIITIMTPGKLFICFHKIIRLSCRALPSYSLRRVIQFHYSQSIIRQPTKQRTKFIVGTDKHNLFNDITIYRSRQLGKFTARLEGNWYPRCSAEFVISVICFTLFSSLSRLKTTSQKLIIAYMQYAVQLVMH